MQLLDSDEDPTVLEAGPVQLALKEVLEEPVLRPHLRSTFRDTKMHALESGLRAAYGVFKDP